MNELRIEEMMNLFSAKIKTTLFAVLLLSLTACGGGGGGGSDSSVTAQDSEGLWDGTTNTGRNARAIVFNDGTYYMLYTGENNTSILSGVIQGNSSMSGNTLSSSNAKDFNLEGLGVLSASISGEVVTKSTLNADITYAGGVTVSFAGSYNSDYELQPLISSLVGQYSGQVATSLGTGDADLTIASDGSLSASTDNGCSSTGNLYERTDGNAYNVQITFANNNLCAFPGQTYEGIAYYDADRAALYSAAPNATRTDGLLFVGTKTQILESTELFQLEDVWKELIDESSSNSFVLSGTYNGYVVSGTGTHTLGRLTTSLFENQQSSAKSATSSLSFTINGQATSSSSISTNYYDSDYRYLGQKSDSEYTVIDSNSFTAPTNTARVNDTGVFYTGTRYSDSNKNTVLGTTQTSYVLEPDTAQTAILKITSIDKDNSGARESTVMVAYRVTPAGSITRLYQTELTDNANLRIDY